ncbi:TRAP transporter large permease [Chloroflexota bacterium]
MEIPNSLVGFLGFLILFLLIFMRFPISFAFLFIGFLGLLYLSSSIAATTALGGIAWTYGTSYTLMAIPLFILMGQFAAGSGIGAELYGTAEKWLGWLPGGAAIATTWGCAGFAAVTGSTTTGILTFGPIAYRPMLERGYDRRLALGTICCGATIGVMIPPSIAFIVYATVTEESVGRLFMAGIFPGILEAVLYSAAIILIAGFGIWAGAPGSPSTWKEKLVSLKGVIGSLTLFIVVIGGIYGGIFTPTEAAAVGAFGSLVILVIRKGIRWTPIRSAVMECLRTTCMVYTLVIGSMVFAHFITLTGLNVWLVEFITAWGAPHLAVLGLTLVVFLGLGCIMPAMPVIVLTVPFLYPIFTAVYGFSGIWFGVLVVAMMELAFVTPPIGVNLFVTKSLFRDEAPMGDIFRGVIPFVISDIFRVVIIVLFPAIALWLPGMMFAR